MHADFERYKTYAHLKQLRDWCVTKDEFPAIEFVNDSYADFLKLALENGVDSATLGTSVLGRYETVETTHTLLREILEDDVIKAEYTEAYEAFSRNVASLRKVRNESFDANALKLEIDFLKACKADLETIANQVRPDRKNTATRFVRTYDFLWSKFGTNVSSIIRVASARVKDRNFTFLYGVDQKNAVSLEFRHVNLNEDLRIYEKMKEDIERVERVRVEEISTRFVNPRPTANCEIRSRIERFPRFWKSGKTSTFS